MSWAYAVEMEKNRAMNSEICFLMMALTYMEINVSFLRVRFLIPRDFRRTSFEVSSGVIRECSKPLRESFEKSRSNLEETPKQDRGMCVDGAVDLRSLFETFSKKRYQHIGKTLY